MGMAHLGAGSVAKCRGPVMVGAGAANATLLPMRTTVGLSALLIAISGFAYACGSADLSSFEPDNGSSGGTPAGGDAGFAGASAPSSQKDLGPVDNGVILVHAAKTKAFRLCFQNELDLRPQPDSQVMPEANVVGVEVGSAVRLPPLRGAPGEVLLFEEALIRSLYPSFGGSNAGLSCDELTTGEGTKGLAVKLGPVATDLSHGVHLLVVRGCPSDPILPTVHKYSVAECGSDWTPAGNLSVTEITLQGAMRPGDGILPAQLVNLSQPLQAASAGRDVVVSFGDLAQATTLHTPVVTNPLLFGGAQPTQPAQLAYPSTNTAIYESLGFRVTFAAGGDAGSEVKVLDESLATIQKGSSPLDVPPTYYSAASNYALLLLGDPAPQLADGGADTDERRTLHLLAVPVIDPNSDAGAAEGGATEPVDGGTGTTP
jgi:hypothetical protein